MRYRRVIDAYGICVDGEGRLLMVPEGPLWSLPGGPVDHGEHPADAVVRLTEARAGGRVEVESLKDAVTDIDGHTHHDVIVFGLRREAGHDGDDGIDSGAAVWRPVDADGLTPLTEAILGRRTTENHHRRRPLTVGRNQTRVQRFAAYGLVLDPAGRVLLTLISDQYPGAGHWHLPGGGTDFGERPAAGLAREIVEETGQRGEIGELVSVSHRHTREARGPEGRAMDWHGVRVVYRVRIDQPSEPTVFERNGSTAAAAWFPVPDALQLPLTEVAREALESVG